MDYFLDENDEQILYSRLLAHINKMHPKKP